MEDIKPGDLDHKGNGRTLALLVFLLLLLMVASIYYPWPSGETLSIGGFIALWFRELLILLLAMIALLFVAYDRLQKVFAERASRSKKRSNSSLKATSDDVA